MRPVNVLEGQIDGDLGGQKVQMEIDANSLAHIMSVLTDLYSDQELAVVREYSTNARDSHVEAGKEDVPILVTTPSSLSPYFVVQDFGVGLSLNDVITIYSKYGASTKRETDAQTGMLGLGGKSALTYTSQFIVTGVKDGMKAQIVVRRAEDGTGVMEIIDHSRTDDENGVTIQIPVQYGATITDKAKNFFRFWQPGTVLLNGEDPSGIVGDGVKQLNDNIFITRNFVDQDYVVMGNVPYPAKHLLADDIFGNAGFYGNTKSQVIAYVEIGAVTFPPSREELSYTVQTKKTLNEIRETIKREITTKIVKDISAAKTAGEAMAVYNEWERSITSSSMLQNLKWQGHNVKTVFDGRGVDYNLNRTRYAATTESRFAYSNMTDDRTIVVTGYKKADTPNSLQKKKIKEYVSHLITPASSRGSINRVLLFDKVPGSPWTDAIETHDWEEINKIKFASNNLSGVRGGSKPILEWSAAGWWEVEELDDEDEIVFCSPTEEIAHDRIVNFAKLCPDVHILQLGANRFKKLQRLFPKAKPFMDAYHAKVRELKDELTKAEIESFQISNVDRKFFQTVESLGLKIDDPQFDELIKKLRVDTTAVERYNGLVGFGKIERSYHSKIGRAGYPLLSALGDYRITEAKIVKDIVTYMNAAFAAQDKE